MPDFPPDDATPPLSGGAKGNPLPAVGLATIDAPQVKDGKLDLKARSVKTASHAWNICKAAEQNNRTRSARTADIQALHDGEPPRSSAQNMERGKGWQSNASTGWLAGIVARDSQRLIAADVSQRYVTAATLPSNIQDWERKTEILRSKLTSILRAWDGDTTLLNNSSVEVSLQGYCYVVFLDPYTYKPTFFKQDRAFVPEQTGSHARDFQFFVAKQDYPLHEFIALFKDEEAAKVNGYDPETGINVINCQFSAENAKMLDPREDATTTQFRKFVEMINEGALGLTYTSTGARIVPTWLLLVREYSGKVSLWLIDREMGKILRFSFEEFESMERSIVAFTFEPGNGCIHSSKGLGRKLAALAIMKELFRNGVIDNARMSGLMILRADAKDRTKFAPVVMAPFIMLDKSMEVAETQIQSHADSYEAVDRLIDSWAEQAVGAYLTAPVNAQGQVEKTATQAQIDKSRENEAADIRIRRWLDQRATLRQIQQERVFADDNLKLAKRLMEEIAADPTKDTPDLYEGHENVDAVALRGIVEVLQQGISEDEIRVWRKSPASVFAHVSDLAAQQASAAALEKLGNNPNIDQQKLTELVTTTLVGPEVAKMIVIPNASQVLPIEAKRKQLMESVAMSVSHIPCPVSPRDNHLLEGQFLREILTMTAPVLSSPQADEKTLQSTQMNLNHLGEHLFIASQMGQLKDPAMKELEKFYDGFKKQFVEVIQIRTEQAAVQQAVVQKLRAEGASLPPSTQPTTDAQPEAQPAIPAGEPPSSGSGVSGVAPVGGV